MLAPSDHPRKASLDIRHRLVEGFEDGLVAEAGLIAHGRGEAFDYLLGEKTVDAARKADEAACAMLLSAGKPVISVNGNAAALVPKDIVVLADAVGARIEVNLFYRTPEREKKIVDHLKAAGAKKVFGLEKKHRIEGLTSERANVDDALWEADVVLVMLEDGDRTEALKAFGKKVIVVDLNPLSRTAQQADITIVDNIVRAIPNITEIAGEFKESKLTCVDGFDNKRNLKKMEDLIREASR